MSARDLWNTALHESAHAVCAHYWGFPVHSIRMSPACPAYTAVTFPFTPATLKGAYLERPWGVPTEMRGILETLMAGAIVEGELLLGHDFHLVILWEPSWVRLRSRLAVQETVPVTQAGTLGLASWDDLCQQALEEVRTLLSTPALQQEITNLASALVQAGKLEEQELRSLLRRTSTRSRSPVARVPAWIRS